MGKLADRAAFKTAFLGEYVELLCKTHNKMLDEGGTLMPIPIPIHGYILDLEGDVVMMGDSPLEINKFVKFDDVIYGEIVDKLNIYEEILNQTPEPESDDEVN